ncbi:BPI fold-containing family A member 2 [Podarcis raffonei]|uniref:BPI fold-containing family A member 2 n=1 Tax=Podarcis raffonei TaxID=65483 RepID=UPI002329449B|nr:BPI fold-containing family A member 2 [Podarcis raffonei]
MFPVLALAIFYGLLAQNTQGYASPQAIVNLGPEMLQRLISHRLDSQALVGRLQNLPLQSILQGGSGGLLGLGNLPVLGGLVDGLLGNILGVKIRNIELLRLDIRFDEVAKHIIVTVPADVEIEINLPLNLGRLLHVKLYLDIQVAVRILTDPVSGHVKLVVGNCHNNPGHLRITLLNKKGPLLQTVNNLLRAVTDILEKTVPHLLQKELCPLVNMLLEDVLNLLQGSSSSYVHGDMIQLRPSSTSLRNGVMQIGYEGTVRLPGGQNYIVPSGTAPLPHAPLGDAPMNMLLSDHLLSAMLRAFLTPRAINIHSPQEITAFSQQMAALSGFKGAIRALQVSYGAPVLALTVGRIEVKQNIDVKVYSGRHLFTVRATVTSLGAVSVAGGSLRLTLHLEGIDNLSLINSSVGNFDVQHLTSAISHLVSAFLLPHQNHLLAEGFPLPLVQQLGIDHLNAAPGQNTLLLFAPPLAS